MKYLTGVYWERGSVADSNQDSLVLLQVLTARGRVLMAAVCDGMGGLMQGEMASGYVTERLQEWFYESLLRAIEKRKAYWIIRRSLDRLVYHVQEQLSKYAKQEEISMGTTMTVLVIWEKTYLLWHLGDSRAYRMGISGRKKRDGGRCITDENDRERRRRNGVRCSRSRLNKNGAECLTTDHVRGKNRLTKCVGSFGYERPDFQMGMIREGQAMLLCSDGFRHCVTEEEITEVLAPRAIDEEEQVARRLREIGEACMKRGEKDNLSAVYVKAVR